MRAQDQDKDRGGRPGAVRAPARPPLASPAAGLLALQRAAGNAAVSRALGEERHEHGAGCGHQAVQRAAAEGHRHGPGCGHEGPRQQGVQRRMAPSGMERAAEERRDSLAEATGKGGSSLAPHILDKAQQAYQMPMDHVVVHNDAVAQRAAADFEARALTVGNHIVLGADKVDDETMFHELDHVRQQSQGEVAGRNDGSGVKVSHEGDDFERQSAANGRRVAQGAAPDLSMPGAPAVQRAADGDRAEGRESVQRMPTSGGRVSKKKGKVKDGASVAAAIVSALVDNHGWEAHGGARDKTVHLPMKPANPPAHATREGLKETKMGGMYHGSGGISGKRSFKQVPVEQALRWISTAAFNYLNDLGKQPEEVQAGVAGVDSAPVAPNTETLKKYELYISSNKDTANKALADLRGTKNNARALLTDLLAANTATVNDTNTERMPFEKRHASKLASRLLGSAEGSERFGELLQALAGPVNIPEGRAEQGEDGLHAERRIMASAPEGSIPANRIAGVKRPCMVCYMELFMGDDSKRPGPFWPSKSSSIGIEDYTVAGAAKLAARIDAAARAAGGTHVTLRVDCGGKERVDTGHGSESDSPASDNAGGRDSSPEAMDTAA
ncbi:DUF4157 domain-containing protein [Streptomyces physcomitrii]|uniref:eCIS core domain-containing protein n=1 Tax=Streptomyces physcomitrii TaxID=2724184 RepID=UPI0033EBEE46